MADSATILLVDDEESVQKLLTYPLERDGYRVVQARDGDEALSRFDAEDVDLVVLDVMIPKIDGLEVCKQLRARSSVPIVMLTARDDELDKVLGLELGADDYITKPFSIREFRSRVRALLRRASAPRYEPRDEAAIEIDGLRIDPGRRVVELDGTPVQLTYVEFELLRTLATRPGRVFSRQSLLSALWGGAEYREPRTIDVHVRHLREKLEPDPGKPRYILTVRGVGYRFKDVSVGVRRFSGVGARLGLALLAVLAGALGLVYLIVVPSLQNRLVNSRLSQLERASDGLARELPADRFRWPDFLDSAAESANARVVIYDYLGPPTALVVVGDSRGTRSTDVERDRLALRAASTGRPASGEAIHRGSRYAEAVTPVPNTNTLLLVSAPLHEALSSVRFVRERLLIAGALALACALGVGYIGALLFARRLRRLETAAERIAAGQFGEPILDTGADEVGQLARTFDRMRVRLAALDHARREFIANASHELRTPLFSLGGFLELMTEEELDEETRREFLQTMREQVDRLAKLAMELLDLSRVDAGQLQVEREPVDLGGGRGNRRRRVRGARAVGRASGRARGPGRCRGARRRAAGAPDRADPRRECARSHPAGDDSAACAPAEECSRSRTTGLGSRRSTWRTCSSGSTAAGAGCRREAGLGSRSPASWRARWVGRWRSSRLLGGPCSRCGLRSQIGSAASDAFSV